MVKGEGGWHRRKQGGSWRPVWRNIHLGINEETLEIRAAAAMSSNVGDVERASATGPSRPARDAARIARPDPDELEVAAPTAGLPTAAPRIGRSRRRLQHAWRPGRRRSPRCGSGPGVPSDRWQSCPHSLPVATRSRGNRKPPGHGRAAGSWGAKASGPDVPAELARVPVTEQGRDMSRIGIRSGGPSTRRLDELREAARPAAHVRSASASDRWKRNASPSSARGDDVQIRSAVMNRFTAPGVPAFRRPRGLDKGALAEGNCGRLPICPTGPVTMRRAPPAEAAPRGGPASVAWQSGQAGAAARGDGSSRLLAAGSHGSAGCGLVGRDGSGRRFPPCRKSRALLPALSDGHGSCGRDVRARQRRARAKRLRDPRRHPQWQIPPDAVRRQPSIRQGGDAVRVPAEWPPCAARRQRKVVVFLPAAT